MDDIWKPIMFAGVAYWSFTIVRSLQAVNHMPGYRPMFNPMSLMGVLLPTSWWNLGLDWRWKYRKTAYFNHTHDIISIVPWLVGQPSYYICSLDVAKQLLADETRMFKPRELSSALLQWGENIFAANGDQWKRHRRIMNPSFNTQTYSMVLTRTQVTYREMTEALGWNGKSEMTIDSASTITLRTAFLVMARCAFGMDLGWVSRSGEARVGDKDAGSALTLVLETNILRLILPEWVYRLPIQRLREIDNTWKAFADFMRTSVQKRQDEMSGDADSVKNSSDTFTRLVSAMENEGKSSLDMDEVIGNTFMLMFAGHETTGVALAETLAYLALYPEYQTQAYDEIMSVIAERDPTLEDLSKLTHTLACFQETLRMFPAGQTLIRTTAEDIIVRVSHPSESTKVLPKGSMLVMDMIAIHRNPNTFSDPEVYRPSRWYNTPEPDLSTFGLGNRACIGRKFAIVEALSFLVMLLRDWEVFPLLSEGETFKEYEALVMSRAGFVGLSFGVKSPIGLQLKRRS